MRPDDADERPLGRRLLWMAALWLAGVAAVGALAAILKLWLG